MTLKVLACLVALAATAMMLLSLRQARIVQVNRMNQVWTQLQAEQLAWKRLRLAISSAARPERFRQDGETGKWSPAIEYTADIDHTADMNTRD